MPKHKIELTIPENATLWGRIAPEFVSFTMDWWSDRHIPWGNSSVLNANFQDPQLIELASALAPSFWRIGGSQADTIVYAPFDSTAKCKRNRCLTRERWDEILDFAAKIGARIVFGLNYLSHTQRDTVDWNSTVTRQFLNYTRHHSLGHVIYGYELGNELTHGGKASNLTRMVVAYQELRSIVDELYNNNNTDDDDSSPPLATPKIMGPASTGRATLEKLLKQLGPEVDIVTYHKYHARGGETSTKEDMEFAMKPSFHSHAYHFQDTSNAVDKYFYQQRKYPTDDNNLLWIGEGAMSYNSGRPGVTNTMISTFWYTNLLAVLSKTQPIAHAVYCRQALLGGYYELIQHNASTLPSGQIGLKPNPDYWIARLYKLTVGQASIGPIVSDEKHRRPKTPLLTWGCCKAPGKDTLLVHFFCAAPTTPAGTQEAHGLQTRPGDVTLVLINMDGTRDFSIKLPMGKLRSQFQMTSASNTSKQEIQINQQHMDGSTNSLGTPVLIESRQPLLIPRESITFAVFHGANIQSCIDLYDEEGVPASPLETTSMLHDKSEGNSEEATGKFLRYPDFESSLSPSSSSSKTPPLLAADVPADINDATLEMNLTFSIRTSIPSLFAVWFVMAFCIIARRIWVKNKEWM